MAFTRTIRIPLRLTAADAALVGLLQAVPRNRIFQLLFRYGARDFRAIGHKAITVANCHRLLEVVPPDHAEALLRSLVSALLNHEGEPNPASSDLPPDRPWRRNLVLAQRSTTLAASDSSQAAAGSVEEIFATLSTDRVDAARQTLAYLSSGGPELPFMTQARRFTVDRNIGYHDYKFTVAAFENASAMGSPWRERYLATSTLYLTGPADPANGFVARARALLQQGS